MADESPEQVAFRLCPAPKSNVNHKFGLCRRCEPIAEAVREERTRREEAEAKAADLFHRLAEDTRCTDDACTVSGGGTATRCEVCFLREAKARQEAEAQIKVLEKSIFDAEEEAEEAGFPEGEYLAAVIKALRECLAVVKSRCLILQATIDPSHCERAERAEQALAKALRLRLYASHNTGCNEYVTSDAWGKGCNCGLDEALADTDPSRP